MLALTRDCGISWAGPCQATWACPELLLDQFRLNFTVSAYYAYVVYRIQQTNKPSVVGNSEQFHKKRSNRLGMWKPVRMKGHEEMS